MARRMSGCRKCRQIGEKLCSKAVRCALERRNSTPGDHGKRHGMMKKSEYARQLREKQKVKLLYGVEEKQFRRMFSIASAQKGVTGENLLSLMECRLDNVLFRLKFASSRPQSRQMVVHGHVQVNGSRVKTPSYVVKEGDTIAIMPSSVKQEAFVENVVKKRLSIAIKVPDWLELKKDSFSGQVLRRPERADVQTPIEEHLIVELYSK